MEEAVLENTTKRILLAFVIVILGLVAYTIYWQSSHTLSGNAYVLEEAKVMKFNGRVDSIGFDERDHDGEFAILSDGYKYGIYSDWRPFIHIGDSIKKDYGSLKVLVIKSNSKIDTLDYKVLIAGFKQ